VLALSAAALIGIQFWHADQGGVYVLWYLPFFLLLVFRPNLSDRMPPTPSAQSAWPIRLGRALGRMALPLLHVPEPAAQVHLNRLPLSPTGRYNPRAISPAWRLVVWLVLFPSS